MRKPNKPAYFGIGANSYQGLRRESRLMEKQDAERAKKGFKEFGMHYHNRTGERLSTPKERNNLINYTPKISKDPWNKPPRNRAR